MYVLWTFLFKYIFHFPLQPIVYKDMFNSALHLSIIDQRNPLNFATLVLTALDYIQIPRKGFT